MFVVSKSIIDNDRLHHFGMAETEELRGKLELFEKHVPRHLPKLSKECSSCVERVTRQILLQERAIFAYHVACMSSGYPHKLLPKQSKLFKIVLSRDVVTNQEVLPAIRQYVGMILSFIHSHVDVFAKAVIESQSDKLFRFVVASVIPSVFGYFSSEESLKVAIVFYTHVLANSTPRLARRIVAPFFNSLASFRYVESVMTSFTSKFGMQLLLNGEARKGAVTSGLVQELCECVIRYIPLLPSSYCTMIQIMKTLNWTAEDIRKLLINNFFFPMIKKWMLASPFAAGIDVLRHAVEEAFSGANFQTICEKLFSFHSQFEPPSMFRCFDLPYVTYTISVAEVLAAFKILKKSVTLPYSVDMKLCGQLSRDEYYAPVIINVFPQESRGFLALTPVVFSVKNVYKAEEGTPEYERTYRAIAKSNEDQSAFTTLQSTQFSVLHADTSFSEFVLKKSFETLTKQARAFETLIANMVYLKSLSNWCELSNIRVVTELLPALVEPSIGEFPVVLANNLLLRRILYLHSRENFLQRALKSCKAQITKFEEDWMTFLEQQRDSLSSFSRNLSSAKKGVFWSTVEELSCIPNVPIHRQYELITSVLRNLELLSDTLDCLIQVAVMSESRILVSRFLLFSTLVVNGTHFVNFMPEQDIRLWSKAESALIDALCSVPESSIQNSFLQLQDSFMSAQD